VDALLNAGALVKVVAPDVTPRINELAAQGMIRLSLRKFRISDLSGAVLAHVATSSPHVNQMATYAAKRKGILVCRADNASDGAFITPSSVVRGRLIASVTTGGDCPAFTSFIHRKLEHEFGEEYAQWTVLFSDLRDDLQSLSSIHLRRMTVKRIMETPDIVALIFAGEIEAARKAAKKCILSASD
jgi:siroheme synthase-like protein